MLLKEGGGEKGVRGGGRLARHQSTVWHTRIFHYIHCAKTLLYAHAEIAK